MHLAPRLGRDQAHKLLYEVCLDARKLNKSFEESLRANLDEKFEALFKEFSFNPADHVGEAPRVALEGVRIWSVSKTELILN
jgi:adenylosuccinate lyase